MKQIIELLSSPVWWVSVVIVGICINLVSAYLKRPLDSFLSWASSWWRTRNTAQIESRAKLIARLRGNISAQIYHAHDALRLQISAIVLMLLLLCLTALDIFLGFIYMDTSAEQPVPSPNSTHNSGLMLFSLIINYFFLALLYIMTLRRFLRGSELGSALREACDPEQAEEIPKAKSKGRISSKA